MYCIIYTVDKRDNINVSNRLCLIKEKRGFKFTSNMARKHISEGCWDITIELVVVTSNDLNREEFYYLLQMDMYRQKQKNCLCSIKILLYTFVISRKNFKQKIISKIVNKQFGLANIKYSLFLIHFR